MPRTMTQERITLLFRADLMEQAQVESATSTVTMAELIRRALDQYLNNFPAPAVYETGELLPETATEPPTAFKKVPFHINPGLLAEADRYAHQIGSNTDEVANRALVLYFVCLEQRRQAAEKLESEAEGQVATTDQFPETPEAITHASDDDLAHEPDPDGGGDDPTRAAA
jgi:hypothetical protein